MPCLSWKNKNPKIVDAFCMPRLFEKLQNTVAEDSEKYGQALPEIEKQLENIQSEFSQFVTLNSSGDPV